jgi:hypothetical protein
MKPFVLSVQRKTSMSDQGSDALKFLKKHSNGDVGSNFSCLDLSAKGALERWLCSNQEGFQSCFATLAFILRLTISVLRGILSPEFIQKIGWLDVRLQLTR